MKAADHAISAGPNSKIGACQKRAFVGAELLCVGIGLAELGAESEQALRKSVSSIAKPEEVSIAKSGIRGLEDAAFNQRFSSKCRLQLAWNQLLAVRERSFNELKSGEWASARCSLEFAVIKCSGKAIAVGSEDTDEL